MLSNKPAFGWGSFLFTLRGRIGTGLGFQRRSSSSKRRELLQFFCFRATTYLGPCLSGIQLSARLSLSPPEDLTACGDPLAAWFEAPHFHASGWKQPDVLESASLWAHRMLSLAHRSVVNLELTSSWRLRFSHSSRWAYSVPVRKLPSKSYHFSRSDSKATRMN